MGCDLVAGQLRSGEQGASFSGWSSRYSCFTTQHHKIMLFKLQVLILTVCFLTSSLAVPFPFASPSKSCNLVRSPTKTSAMCFSEPECEQKCSTTYKQQCSTQQERKCSTVSEQQCATVREQRYNTLNEQKCNTVNEQKCNTGKLHG